MERLQDVCLLCDTHLDGTLSVQASKENNFRGLEVDLEVDVPLLTSKHVKVCNVCDDLLSNYEVLVEKLNKLYWGRARSYGIFKQNIIKRTVYQDVQTQTPPYTLADGHFNCFICNAAYKQEQALCKHLKTHKDKPIKCSYCLSSLKDPLGLYKHNCHCLPRLDHLYQEVSVESSSLSGDINNCAITQESNHCLPITQESNHCLPRLDHLYQEVSVESSSLSGDINNCAITQESNSDTGELDSQDTINLAQTPPVKTKARVEGFCPSGVEGQKTTRTTRLKTRLQNKNKSSHVRKGSLNQPGPIITNEGNTLSTTCLESKISRKFMGSERTINGKTKKKATKPSPGDKLITNHVDEIISETKFQRNVDHVKINLADYTAAKLKKTERNSVKTSTYCSVCNINFSTKELLDEHNFTHKDMKLFKCQQCDMSFRWKHVLKVHNRTHTGAKPYTCSWCNRTFGQRTTLDRHQRTHTGEKMFHCDLCDSKFTRLARLKIHQASHTGERPYKCKKCDASFADPQYYKKHMMDHEGLKPFKCRVCSKSFAMHRYLTEHMKTHTGEKKYLCAICASSFPNSGRLRRHMLVHTREKAFRCQFCEKVFSYRETLKEHIDVHNGTKPYLCTECGKSFAHRTGLQQHKTVHSTEKKHVCVTCLKCFKTGNTLKRHQKTHSESQTPVGFTKHKNDEPVPENIAMTTTTECPVIEVLPLIQGKDNFENGLSVGTECDQKDINDMNESIQPLIQVINQALASQQQNEIDKSTETSLTLMTENSENTMTSSSIYQQATNSTMYRLVPSSSSSGGSVLYQSAESILQQLNNQESKTPFSLNHENDITVMEIQVPQVKHEIQIPTNDHDMVETNNIVIQ